MWMLLAYIVVFWIIALSTYEYFTKKKDEQTAKKGLVTCFVAIGAAEFAIKKLEEEFASHQKYFKDLQYETDKHHNETDKYEDRIASLENSFAQVSKIAEETKKTLNHLNVTQAFIPRSKRIDETKKPN